jgi:hypothetical protein
MEREDMIPSALKGLFCAVKPEAEEPFDESLAMVYSPKQEFRRLYEAEEGLSKGTVFCELYKPLWAGGGE